MRLWWWIQNITSREGQTPREGECATCRGVYQKRDMLLYLKMLFFSKFIADTDKQDLFIYFMAVTGLLKVVYSDRFSPQKRLFAEHFRVLLLKIPNFKNILKCRNMQLFLFPRPKLQLSNDWLLKKGKMFQAPEQQRVFRFPWGTSGKDLGGPGAGGRGSQGSGMGWGVPRSWGRRGYQPQLPLLPPAMGKDALLRDTLDLPSKYSSSYTKWERGRKTQLCVRSSQLFRGDIQQTASPASPKPALCENPNGKWQR